jgi:hypothetical protein
VLRLLIKVRGWRGVMLIRSGERVGIRRRGRMIRKGMMMLVGKYETPKMFDTLLSV